MFMHSLKARKNYGKTPKKKNMKIRSVNARRPKMRCESDPPTPSNVSWVPSHGAKPSSSMSSISIFWIRGHLSLGAPLTGMCGKIQKHLMLPHEMLSFSGFEIEYFLVFMQAVLPRTLLFFFGNNEGTGTSWFTALAKKQYFKGKQRVAIRAFSYLVDFHMK